MSEKQCGKCKQYFDKSNFSKKKSAKDGLQIWCNDCLKEYNASKRREYNNNVNARKLKNVAKLTKLIENLPKVEYDLAKAYCTVSKSRDTRSETNAQQFLEGLDQDVVDLVLSKLKSSPIVSNFLIDYLKRAHEEGTLSEQNSALTLVLKLMQKFSDKIEIRSGGLSAKERKEKRDEILKQLGSKIVDAEILGEDTTKEIK